MVPNVDHSYNGLTLEQAKEVDRAIDTSDSYKSTRANAGDTAREIVANAENDKKLKMRKKGARLANKTSKTARQPSTGTEAKASTWASESTEVESSIVDFPVEAMEEGVN